MKLPTLDPRELERVVDAALREDLGQAGDRTTDAVLPQPRHGLARFVARQDLIVAGLPVAREVFHRLDGGLAFQAECGDADAASAGTVLARVSGSAQPILRGERTALNFLMRMSGIATATRTAVEEIEGTSARVLDTRKTAPGLRHLDKYAVAAGGGTNHRLGLFDAIMIKDTHLAVVPDLRQAIALAVQSGLPPEKITVEVRDLHELRLVLDSGAGRALLDNMSLEQLRAAVQLAAGRIVLEASGGLRPGVLRAVAETGVDCLSLGWLTHSAPAADISMELETLD